MIVVYLLLLALTIAFIFLPQTIRAFELPITQPDTFSLTLRFLLNFRYHLIGYYQRFRPKYVGTISKLHVFPMKSCGYIEVKEWELDDHGFKHDRQYMLAHWDSKAKEYQAYTQRSFPQMSLINITYNLEENWFEFTYPVLNEKYENPTNEFKSFKLPCEVSETFIKDNCTTPEELPTELWGVKFQSFDIGKALPSDFCKDLRLMKEGTTLLYSAQGKFAEVGHPKDLKEMRKVLFQDYYPLHILAQTAVDELNARMKDTGSDRQVETIQFRPNVVIIDEQSDLDFWYRVTINGHKWSVVMKCVRCSMGNVQMGKGVFDKTSMVTKTLGSYRRIDPYNRSGFFLGQNAIHHDSGYKIAVGDKFYLTQHGITTTVPK